MNSHFHENIFLCKLIYVICSLKYDTYYITTYDPIFYSIFFSVVSEKSDAFLLACLRTDKEHDLTSEFYYVGLTCFVWFVKKKKILHDWSKNKYKKPSFHFLLSKLSWNVLYTVVKSYFHSSLIADKPYKVAF